MKRNFIFIILLLALFTGQAEAQRRLPGMKSVRFTAEMADGFYSRADRHDAGYALFRWLLPLTQRKGTSGCLAVRCYNVITLTGTHMSHCRNIQGKAVIIIQSFPHPASLSF